MSRYPRLVKDLDQSEYEELLEEYKELLESDKKLQALEDAGVDNWEGFSYSQVLLEQNEPHDPGYYEDEDNFS